MVVSRYGYRSPPRTESHEGRQNPSRVRPCQKFAVRFPTPASGGLAEKCDVIQEFREACASCCAISRPARWQRGGSDESGPSLVPWSTRVVSGRRHHRLRISVGHLTCRDRKLEESLLKRRGVRALAARRSLQTALGKFVKSVKECAFHLVEDVEVDDARLAYPNCCFVLGVQQHDGSQLLACRGGSLAVVQSIWVQQTAKELTSCGSVHPQLANNVHAPVRVGGIEIEGCCHIVCAISPMMVDRDRSLRNKSIHQDKSPRWVGPHGPSLASMGHQAPAPDSKLGIQRTFVISITLQQQRCSRRQPTLWGSPARPCTKRVTVEPASIG